MNRIMSKQKMRFISLLYQAVVNNNLVIIIQRSLSALRKMNTTYFFRQVLIETHSVHDSSANKQQTRHKVCDTTFYVNIQRITSLVRLQYTFISLTRLNYPLLLGNRLE